jgi:uncharacterized peroxidase-related enzyme
LKSDPGSAPLDERGRAVVDYALKLTLTPQVVRREDILGLRNAGLSDGAIHDVAAIVAYFNFVNRLALGLGVEIEREAGGVEDGPRAGE